MLQLELLWRLTCIDKEINGIKKDSTNRELYNRLNQIKDMYTKVKKEADDEIKSMEEGMKKSEQLSEELKSCDDKLKSCNSRLYQNGQNLKAIDSLQKEIESYKQKVDQLENELINIMDRNEKLNESINEKKKQLKILKAEVEELKRSYIDFSEKCSKALEELNLKRENIVKEIDVSFIKQYDEIASKKACAVSAVKDGTCSECGIKLNAVLYDELKRDDSICKCQYCGRILYKE